MDKFYKPPFRWLINALGKKYDTYFPEAPVFIGGCGRSGTTILLSVLSAHKELFCHPKELGIFNNARIVNDGVEMPNRHRLRLSFLMNRVPRTAKRWVEKSPSNVCLIDRIEAYTMGNFKFIHIVRDGRDVILSRHPTDPKRYWVNPDRWIHDVSKGLEWSNDPRIHLIKYEDLLSKYEETIRGVCDHIGIDTSPEILDWHNHARVTENRAFFSKVQPLTTASIGKWKQSKYTERVAELTNRPEARELLQKLGYLE